MKETRHTANTVRYLYGTPQGILEFRAIPTRTSHIKTLIVHAPGCDAESCNPDLCDAESADDLALSWLAGDDQGVWYELALYAHDREQYETTGVPHEPAAADRALIARLRAEGQRMVDEGHFRL